MSTIQRLPCAPAALEDLQPFERLVAHAASVFATIEEDDVPDEVLGTLEALGRLFGANECTLLACGHEPAVADGASQAAAVARTRHPEILGAWAAEPHRPFEVADLEEIPWVLQRLSRNAVVALTAMGDWPHAAARDRAHALRTGITTRLAVPVAIGRRVGYALLLGARTGHGGWSEAAVERVRTIGAMIGAGLDRVRLAPAGAAVPVDHERAAPVGDESDSATSAARILGDSAPMRQAFARLSAVAPLDATVLLRGETGTGKELFARALHERSPRHARPFVRVNCASLPAGLIESELFGHERGAFTGAVAMRQGRFEVADGGTIFLDEIGDLALDLQAKLLRVLQEREFERIGSTKPRPVNVRVIAATHVDLERAVAEGSFRADLYYRLNVFPITLPPLRERPEDVPLLTWSVIRRRRRSLSRHITVVPDTVMAALQHYDWPGNVRELENVIERAMIGSPDGVLTLDERLGEAPLPPASPVAAAETLDALQRHHIEKVLRECGGRINGAGNAAVRLGIHPNTLRFRIKKLGVVLPTRPGASLGATRPSAARPG